MTKEEIKKLKNQYPDGKLITISGVQGYLKRPDRATIKYAMSKQINLSGGTMDMVSSGEVVLSKCLIGGETEKILKDDAYYFRACNEAYKFMQEITGFLAVS